MKFYYKINVRRSDFFRQNNPLATPPPKNLLKLLSSISYNFQFIMRLNGQGVCLYVRRCHGNRFHDNKSNYIVVPDAMDDSTWSTNCITATCHYNNLFEFLRALDFKWNRPYYFHSVHLRVTSRKRISSIFTQRCYFYWYYCWWI